MKKLFKHKTFWLSLVALLLVVATTLDSALAYFTTYVSAEGGYEITLGTETEIEEDVEDMTKVIVLENTGEADCYVRVKLYIGSQLSITYSGAVDDNGNAYWTKGDDDYWYYSEILAPGEKTEALYAEIVIPEELEIDSFNVVVIQECTSVQSYEDGTTYADWSKKADTNTDIGTAEVTLEDAQ